MADIVQDPRLTDQDLCRPPEDVPRLQQARPVPFPPYRFSALLGVGGTIVLLAVFAIT